MRHYSPGIRTKLIAIFILIKVLPLIALAWFAWDMIFDLGASVEQNFTTMISDTQEVVKEMTDLATENSIQALDSKSRETIERLTTDTALEVASFLYDRDRDIELASQLSRDREQYRRFLSRRFRPVILHDEWVMDPEGQRWVPAKSADATQSQTVTAQNDDNRRDFHYRPPDREGIIKNRPMYLEMTLVDLSGQELLKVTTSDILPGDLRDVSRRENTYCRAETYFQSLKKLKPGEIYVSEVIGPYIGTHMIGTYNRKRADDMGIAFAPERSGYAGKENPVGKRFQGLVRWATPVVAGGKVVAYVTLALDHTHIMEFTDHVVPTEERYSPISDAGSGNYAFMWDYKGRNISHPRDYFIVGYDPRTGEQAVPWLDEEMYQLWVESGRSMSVFEQRAPQFKEQALSKKASKVLTRAGIVGLDGRYLNFAPQCAGWHNLTQYGGSGSFLIFWSGLWKLTTAATIPYHTGIYGQNPRGFGYVTIGANVDEFHRPAVETATTIHGIETRFHEKLENDKKKNQNLITAKLQKAFQDLSFYTMLMIAIVIFIAIFMAATLTSKITDIIRGIRRFQKGDRSHRLKQQSSDEMGQLTEAFNEMADTVEKYIGDIEVSKEQIETVNARLTEEIRERQEAQVELSKHRDNLEELVKGRTAELEKEIVERRRVENMQRECEDRLRNQNKTLLHLAGQESLYSGELGESLKIIMERAARTLKVERGSVWMFDESCTKSCCNELYILSADCHSADGVVSVADQPRYFAAIQAERTIAASDALGDQRLAELDRDYLKSLDIRSILDAAILDGADLVGILRFEEVRRQRQWQLDELNFANSIADMVALAMGAAKRKQAVKTREQLEARLQRAEKMEAIGTLAGGVAHDLNNILSGVVSYPELLLHQMTAESPLRKPMETILNAGKRASTIVQDLLTLARGGVAITEVVNLNQVIDDYLKSPEHHKIMTFFPSARISTRLDRDLINIQGSSAHLSKTLMNIIINALEACADSGDITITTQNSYVDRPFKGYDMVNEGEYAALTVTDTGVGISAEDMNHIFEPFYTKKKMGRSGTGLGMAVVWGTVKDHKGYIDFDSTMGKGSRFTLYFPVTRKVSTEIRGFSMEEHKGNNESILVVDDIKEQREIASAILSELEYRVTTISSGEAAVAYLKENTADLLVLDMIMDPGMDGLDTFRQIIELHPDQKAIVASGFSETDRLKEVLRLGVKGYLKKPYTVENIAAAVKSVLDNGSFTAPLN
jgi:signal transduction histidine kinase/ActR/RegA family two-component response regulator/HAMP domain-containing protein